MNGSEPVASGAADGRPTEVSTSDVGVSTSDDEGAMSAEYAVATVAAVAFASLLIAVIRSPEIREALLGIIRGALTV